MKAKRRNLFTRYLIYGRRKHEQTTLEMHVLLTLS